MIIFTLINVVLSYKIKVLLNMIWFLIIMYVCNPELIL
jgi:hypothetical protein